MASEGNKDVPNEALSVDLSSVSGAKRKRGRPRKYEYPAYELPQKVQPLQSALPLHCSQDGSSIASHTSGGCAHGNWSAQPMNSVNASLQGNSGKDDVLGKHFVGKLTKKIPGFSLITVKVKDDQVLRGWVPDEINLRPITPKDDLAPELPMLRPSRVQKRASAIHMQTALAVPMHMEDVTLAKPLQMRRPVEETIAKHAMPLPPRPYMGSGVVAPVPISVAPSNPETTTLTRQGAELVIPQSSVAAVPIKSVRPCKQLANQNEFTEKNYVDEFQKDSESRNVTKELPGERQQLNDQVTDVVTESSGARDQPNSANREQHEQQSSRKPSDITEQSEQTKTETDVQKGADASKSDASVPDDIQPARDEQEIKVACK